MSAVFASMAAFSGQAVSSPLLEESLSLPLEELSEDSESPRPRAGGAVDWWRAGLGAGEHDVAWSSVGVLVVLFCFVEEVEGVVGRPLGPILDYKEILKLKYQNLEPTLGLSGSLLTS